ncbi:type IV pili methyl-accepting chemotaxis transducer N-terminal domain-containing protein [Terasakiella sp. SH-1]|uniref:type IV pili methyl-accepting chemotaxis transducer N-terminal domain-containing protein n=1 Tax=Terasakiella sp. SH-1 TaxID=2560057 RepID=UPI001073AD4C|nr:type IV pili methyl-accepting chemotaxis transducer N-terminal domain-containing protein [Terasakiella sp. SH-1]
MRKLFLHCAIICSSLLLGDFSTPASAQDEIQIKKLNIAGRQRMLSQRIARAACFIGNYHDLKGHRKMLAQAMKTFDESHDLLKNGHVADGFPKEADPQILAELEKLDQPWTMLKFAASVLRDSASQPGLDVDMIAALNMAALKQAHSVVETMARTYSGDQKATGSSRSIDIAGRQRMLSQKAAKEFCLVSYGLNIDQNRQDLLKTVQMFDSALDDLRNGNPARNIPPAPSLNIRTELTQLKTQWQTPRAIMLAVANGTDAREKDFDVIAQTNDDILKQANKVVEMLVAYYGRFEKS